MNSGADYRAIADENVEQFALRCELVAEPGERVIYSDFGFIALGVVIERVTGSRCSALAATFLLASLTFRPRAAQRAKFRRRKKTTGAAACKASCTTKKPISWAASPATRGSSVRPPTSRR